MLSFWERESFLHYDRIVIGSGIVGLSTTASLLEQNPRLRVLVLERGIFPSGASTRNAGFACYGSAAEILSDIASLGEMRALEVVEMRVKGLQRLRKRLGDATIGYEEWGGGELFREDETFDPASIAELNRLLRPIFGKDPFECQPLDRAAGLGFRTGRLRAWVHNSVEGQIHTGFMMKSLLSLCREKGAEILTGVTCRKPQWTGSIWQVEVEGHPAVFEAPGVAICTNAFASDFFPGWDIRPGRGQVLITHPIPGLPFRGLFHFDEGYYYFRNVGTRVLFGGGRNLDFEGETTHAIELNTRIQDSLEKHLREWILPEGTAFTVDQRWAGIMAFGSEKVPVIRDLGNGLAAGVRMNGMGVAIGPEIGARLAAMLAP
jgi:gamma-glutamylputrescine oxidase